MNATTALTLSDIITRMETAGWNLALRNGSVTRWFQNKFAGEFEIVIANGEQWVIANTIEFWCSTLLQGLQYEIDRDLHVVRYWDKSGKYHALMYHELDQLCQENQELMDIADLRYYADMENN